MEEDTERVVGFVTAQLVFLAALIHLSLGLFNWIRWFEAGFLVPQDARWPVFVLSGFALLVGAFYAARADDRRPFYAAGVVVMLGYVLAYFGWHIGGHRLLLVVGPSPGTTEVLSVQWFLDHLFAGPVEFVSILVETLGAVGLTLLYVAGGSDAPE